MTRAWRACLLPARTRARPDGRVGQATYAVGGKALLAEQLVGQQGAPAPVRSSFAPGQVGKRCRQGP